MPVPAAAGSTPAAASAAACEQAASRIASASAVSIGMPVSASAPYSAVRVAERTKPFAVRRSAGALDGAALPVQAARSASSA